jgi:hypothetical protein
VTWRSHRFYQLVLALFELHSFTFLRVLPLRPSSKQWQHLNQDLQFAAATHYLLNLNLDKFGGWQGFNFLREWLVFDKVLCYLIVKHIKWVFYLENL